MSLIWGSKDDKKLQEKTVDKKIEKKVNDDDSSSDDKTEDEEKSEEGKKEEDKKTPLFEKKPPEPLKPLMEDLPEGVHESNPVSTTIRFKDVETRKFMHINLEDLLKFDENCTVKIKGLKFSITNWNELKCQSTSLAYTNTPLVDEEISEWCVEDFVQTFKTTQKIDEFIINEPKCVWTMKSEKENVDSSVFHSLFPEEKKITKSDQQIASEVLYLRGKEAPFSLGTTMFSIKRTYEGDICLFVEVSVLYEKNLF